MSQLRMNHYRIFDRPIRSEIDLPELAPECPEDVGAVAIACLHDDPPGSIDWFRNECEAPGEPWYQLGRHGSDYWLRFPGFADFRLRPAVPCIEGRCHPKLPPASFRHLLLDHVVPLLLSADGNVVIHGSAIRLGGEAVLFLGASGAGKSTLAAALGFAGCSVLADDSLLLEDRAGKVWGVPGYSGLRLWPESVACLYGDVATAETSRQKRRLSAPGRADCGPAPLRCVYLLDESPEITITPLGLCDAVLGLIRHTFRLDPTDRTSSEREFSALSQWVDRFAIRRFGYPRAFRHLEAVIAALRADFEHPV